MRLNATLILHSPTEKTNNAVWTFHILDLLSMYVLLLDTALLN